MSGAGRGEATWLEVRLGARLASVRVLNELRDLPVPVDITVVDPAHLEEEASVPGIVRAAMREGRVLAAT